MNASINTEAFFEKILTLVCEWVQETECKILQQGKPLDPQQFNDALKIGIKHPEKVRVLPVLVFELPKNGELRALFSWHNFYPPNMAAAHHHYGILIRRDCLGHRETLAHELTHVKQHEQLGGIEAYYREYIGQFRLHGYRAMPLEIEARQTAQAIIRGEI